MRIHFGGAAALVTNYSTLSDEELIRLFRNGESAAGGELAVRYRPVIKRCTRPYFLIGGDSEDLIQEGMIGLVSSMQSYQIGGDTSFRTYAELCIKRRILSAIKAASRFKHMPLNYRMSLEELYSDDGEAIADMPDTRYNRSPEELYIEQEKKDNLYMLANKLLSPLERKVLAAYLDGLSYEEIAGKCSKPVKSVDSALQRIRRKLSRAVEEHSA